MIDKVDLWQRFIAWQKENYAVIIDTVPDMSKERHAHYYARVIQFLNDELDVWFGTDDAILNEYLKAFSIDLAPAGLS